MSERVCRVERTTRETALVAGINLEGGACRVSTGVGFLDHMLITLAKHARIGLELEGKGDLEVDAHHTVEDSGLVLGEALDGALRDRAGIARFGFAYAPLDEALARAVVDLSGRPFSRVEVPAELLHAFVTPQFPFTLVGEFWRAVAMRGRFALHLDLERCVDPHHGAEAMFKAGALALQQAVCIDGNMVPSTKGTLSR